MLIAGLSRRARPGRKLGKGAGNGACAGVEEPKRAAVEDQCAAQSNLPSHGIDPGVSIAGTSLSLVLPCFNEERNIEGTIRSAQDWFRDAHIDGEIVVTDDGSTDGSLKLLQKLQLEIPNLRIVRHDKNQGYGAAIRSGCDQAKKTWIAFMDSDGQFHASDIGRLLHLTAHMDYVTGFRKKRADTFQRKLNSLLYNALVRTLLGVHPSDLNCGMKVFRRSIWNAIRPIYSTGALINGEMFFALKNAHIDWAEIAVPHYPRAAGKPTGANLGVILRTFKELWQLKQARGRLDLHADEEHDTPPLAA